MASLSAILNGMLAWAPNGYREFIELRPSLSVAKVETTRMKLFESGGTWFDYLRRINTLVNSQAIYLADKVGQDRWGPWRIVDGLRRGDCEDYAIHKLQGLIAAGFLRGACRLAICEIIPKGLDHSKSKPVYHCVLLIYYRNNPKPLILDNRRKEILHIGEGAANEYRWIAEEFPGHSFWWRKLS